MSMCYKTKFKEACIRTKGFGLKVPEVRCSDDVFITKNEASRLPFLLKSNICNSNIDALFGICMQAHSAAKPILEKNYDCDIYLTFGYVERDGLQLFEFKEDDIVKWINEGYQKLRYLHCWLTLPTMEIIDLTMQTAVANASDNKYGCVNEYILGKADKLSEKYGIYFPLIIGDDFLMKINTLK